MGSSRAPLRARVVESWRAWTRPSPEIADRTLQWRAHLLASLMLAGIPLTLLMTGLSWVLGSAVPELPRAAELLPLVTMGLAYGLARTRYWRVGAWLVVLVVGLNSMLHMALRQEPYLAMFMGLAIVLGAMILPKKDTLVLLGLTLLALVTMPLWAGASFTALQQAMIGGFFGVLSLMLAVASASRDTLERQRLEALAQSEARFRGLLQVAFEGLVELRDGRIVELNLGFMEITGRSEAELKGRMLSSIVQVESSRPPRDTSTTASYSIRPGTKEATGTRPNGEVFHVELVSRLLMGDSGPVEYVAVRDITERRKAQLQLSIAHRAVALGTLSAGIAHEINNPLSWMMTNLQMAQDELRHGDMVRHRTPEQDGLLHTLDDALQGGRRVMAIVRDLKTMSREGSDQGVADVNAALDLACRIASRQIEARARLVRDYGSVPPVRGSAGRLGQVFLNLLINAAQAIPEGKRDAHHITLRTRHVPDPSDDQPDDHPHGQVEVVIRDTGRGIPSTVLPHIFDPFYTTKSKEEGTGLGLSITRSVIDGMGGTITADSREGEGATFTLRLPVAEGAPVSEHPPAHDPTPPGGRAIVPGQARVRVLIVDDEPLLGKSLRRALPEHEVVFTEDPAHALELCQQTEFDVIVCDLMMPVISGQDLYEQLHEQNPQLAARVIFMTGGAFTARAQQFLESIDNPVLGKPFTPNDLRVAVKRMLDSPAT